MNARRAIVSGVILSLGLGTAHCGDDPKGLPVGSTCGADEDCAAGLCFAQVCIDPALDDDSDGLINSLEVGLETNPTKADSDDDGKPDPDELGADFSALDADGDGLIDALESAILDNDLDCLSNEVDSEDKRPSSMASPLVAEVCPTVGVCGVEGAELAVACPDGLDGEARCDMRRVAGHEDEEATCDGADNDCDGRVDEVCGLVYEGLVGHWMLDADGKDSGPYGDDGVVEGAEATTDRFGVAGMAMRFDGDADRVEVAATHHPLGDGDFSYTAWVRPDAGAEGGVVSIGEILENRGARMDVGARGCIAFSTGTASDASEVACAPAGHWSFLAIVRQGATSRFYLDGRLANEGKVGTLDMRRTGLTIGAVKQLASGETYGAFEGVLDDVRIYGRALTEAELAVLFGEGGWKAPGDASNPGQSCRHVLDAGGRSGDGLVTLDVDGDGPTEAFEAYCDQGTDGGGWTLAWVYDFKSPTAFTSADNAVMPIPSWPAEKANVEVSEEAPTDPLTKGAIAWESWAAIGRSFRIESPVFGSLVCDAEADGAGSLSTGIEGPVSCRWLSGEDCGLPDWVFFWEFGPGLSAENLFLYFDGSTDDNWPTHDRCGGNSAPEGLAEVLTGAVYLR